MNTAIAWLLRIVGLACILFNCRATPLLAAISTSGNLAGGGTPYNGADDPWVVTSLIVGDTAPGSLAIGGGSDVNNTNSGIIANTAAASTSMVTVDGVGSTWTNSQGLDVGLSGVGRLEITGGGSVVVNDSGGGIGGFSGSDGTVVVAGAGSTLNITSFSLTVGVNGTGRLEISGGGSVTNNSGQIGNGHDAGGNGSVTVDGAGSKWTIRSPFISNVGGRGTGTLEIKNGGNVSMLIVRIGNIADSNGKVTVDGAASRWTTERLHVGLGGDGIVDITGGAKVTSFNSFPFGSNIGETAGSSGVVTVDGIGSSWTTNQAIAVGIGGAGILNVKNGALVSASRIDGGNATSSINLDGGALQISTAGADSASNEFNLLTGGGAFDILNAAATFTVTSAIDGVGGLTKAGNGTLILSNSNNDYNGDTTLLPGGPLSITSAFLEDGRDVYLTTGSVFNLDFPGFDTIRSLYLDGAPLPTGTYSALTSETAGLITGSGSLIVTAEPDADFDDDDDVDGNDFLIWQRGLGGAGTANANGNADSDSDVDGEDLARWKGGFGAVTPVAAGVPEPSAACLALAAVIAFAAVRRS